MEQDIRFCTTVDGVTIAYSLAGSGPPLVRSLGWFTHLEMEWEWPGTREFWEQLAQHCTIVRYDGRGTGLSDRDVTTISSETRLRDLEAVVDALQLERFALFGVSEGGASAVSYAVAHPERLTQLAIWGSFAKWGHEDRSANDLTDGQRGLIDLLRAGWGRDSAQVRQMITGGFAPAATREQADYFSQLMLASASAEVTAHILESVYSTDVREPATQVRTPTMVAHRRGDQAIPFAWGRRLATLIPDARFLPLEGDNHAFGMDPTEDQPLIDALLNFVGTQDPPSPSKGGAFRTILFTDVVASTPLLAQLKDAKMRDVMRAHDALLDAAVAEHGGRVVKEIGDAFMVEFAIPSAAVECAIAIQRGIRDQFADSDVPIRLRIGINAGEPVAEDGDSHGASVNIAKRLESAAATNGILVSDVVKQAVVGKDFEFADQGEVALKGFDDPVHAWSVEWA